MVTNEQEFLRWINSNHVDTYREAFRMFYRYLVVYAIRLVQHQEVAEDIVQEVFISLWKKENKAYNSLHGFRSFLYESVKNNCLNYLKHKKLESQYADYILYTGSEEEEDAENYELMREEIYRKLYQIISELPESCRKVFELHMAGKKNEEIATLLHISVETVKVHKKRALQTLRYRLKDIYLLLLLLKII